MLSKVLTPCTHNLILLYCLASLLTFLCCLDIGFEACSPNGAVRLVNGTEEEGTVEYCYNGYWNAICADLEIGEIDFFCKKLGYTTGGKINK